MNDWLAQVFSHPATVHDGLLIALKTTVIYVFLIGGLRLLGKRELGQMTVYDLVLMIVLANAVQNAMVGDDNTLFGGLISATTLILLNRLLRYLLKRSSRLERTLVGEPVVLLNDGKLMTETMDREGITREQVLAALREHGLDSLEDAHICVLEVDGEISVVPTNAIVHRTRRHYRALRLN
jgi:uncharacterized membrane protein YcaP (DUF421 family)